MSPPHLDILEEGESNVSIVDSTTSLDSICQNNPGLRERNYMGLSDTSSVGSSSISSLSEEQKGIINLKATELRLGLPGSESPERNAELCLLSHGNLDEKPLFPFLPSKDGVSSPSHKNVISGNKRGFADAMNGFSGTKNNVFAEGNWMFPSAGNKSETAQSVAQGKYPVSSGMISSKSSLNLAATSHSAKDQSGVESSMPKDIPSKGSHDMPRGANEKSKNQITLGTNTGSPPAKAHVVGWPPIRSFQKNSLSTA
ncbi:hypothetical protein ACHQM5_023834 [Ranunculus cassubicifolius]